MRTRLRRARRPGPAPIAALVAGLAAAALPWWLPGVVVRLRMWVFARVNGDEAIQVPGDVVDVAHFREVYSHPAANGRSRGARLSDLFWYWLAPGPELHQEHLEPGERYEQVARCTRRILSVPRAEAEELASRCAAGVLDGVRDGGLVRLRDLAMPIWAAYYYELVFGEPCPPRARRLIVDNATDVVTALKCSGLRHMRRRNGLTGFLEARLASGGVPHGLPPGMTTGEHALYLQGTFFNTAIVQTSEALAHVLMILARHPETHERVLADDAYLDRVIEEAFRRYPLFGIAHRITTDEIRVGDAVLPTGSVLCFNYPEFHRAGFDEPDRFDPSRWERLAVRDANHIPFGIATNRPCPAWRLAPITLRVAVRETLARFTPQTTAAHSRSLPNRGPCLLVPRSPGAERSRSLARRRALLGYVWVRDRWEDVGRSVVQLVLGTYMVLDARRLRLCQRHFEAAGTDEGAPAGRSF